MKILEKMENPALLSSNKSHNTMTTLNSGFTILFAILAISSYAQSDGCIEGDCQDGIGVKTGQFTSGEAFTYHGEFKYGKYNGTGKIVSKDYIADGVFYNGDFVKGVIEDSEKHIEGTFVNNRLHGDSCLIISQSETLRRKLTGKFINGALYTGNEIIYHNNGRVNTITYFEGSIIRTLDNGTNHYDPFDLIGPNQTTVNLTVIDDETYIPLSIGNVDLDIKWDTGAWNLALSKSDYNRLIKAGVEFKNLDMTVSTMGILSIATESQILLLDEITIGELRVKNVVCSYNPNIRRSLLGMDFWEKYGNVIWNLKDKSLVIVK